MSKKNTETEDIVMSPADIAKKHKVESEERKEAAKFRFPEGDDFKGKIIRAEDTLSQKKKTPCYEIEVQTKEKNAKGKKAKIIIRFMKNNRSMGFFYTFLDLAGADLNTLTLSHIKDLKEQQAKRDEMIDELLETLEDESPKIVFNSAHQDPPSTYNNYYVNECEKVLVSDDGGTDEKPEESRKSDEPKKADKAESGATSGNSDNAFGDDDDD